MWAVLKRELHAYFSSPVGYVFMGFFLLVSGLFFAAFNIFRGSSQFNSLLGNITFIFLLLVPILTMRLLSDERRTKTDQLLLTSPVSISAIVIGKYLAAVSVFLITLLVTAIYPIILFALGNPSLGEILGGYVGFFLMGSVFIAVGLFVSATTESQVTSAVATFGLLLSMWIVDWITPNINNQLIVNILGWFSVLKRFENFAIGIFSFAPIVYYLTFAVIFVFLTIRVIERRRWSEG